MKELFEELFDLMKDSDFIRLEMNLSENKIKIYIIDDEFNEELIIYLRNEMIYIEKLENSEYIELFSINSIILDELFENNQIIIDFIRYFINSLYENEII